MNLAYYFREMTAKVNISLSFRFRNESNSCFSMLNACKPNFILPIGYAIGYASRRRYKKTNEMCRYLIIVLFSVLQ